MKSIEQTVNDIDMIIRNDWLDKKVKLIIIRCMSGLRNNVEKEYISSYVKTRL